MNDSCPSARGFGGTLFSSLLVKSLVITHVNTLVRILANDRVKTQVNTNGHTSENIQTSGNVYLVEKGSRRIVAFTGDPTPCQLKCAQLGCEKYKRKAKRYESAFLPPRNHPETSSSHEVWHYMYVYYCFPLVQSRGSIGTHSDHDPAWQPACHLDSAAP